MSTHGRPCAQSAARWIVLILATAGIAVTPALAAAGPEVLAKRLRPAHPTRIVVRYRASSQVTERSSLDRLQRELGVRHARPLFSRPHPRARGGQGSAPDLDRYYVLELPAGTDVALAAAHLAAEPAVASAEPDYVLQATFEPNDILFDDLWNLAVTDAPTAWDTATGLGRVVAVIDTGVDQTHPDLAANLWTNAGEIAGNGVDDDGNGYVDDVQGWDFVDDDATPFDLNGHGTHVAGTVAAVGNNGLGIVGMAWGARIMAVRGLDARGTGYSSDLAQAIVYAAENGADVLNNSWGGFASSQVLTDAVATASALGVVVVAAAGNASSPYVEQFTPAGIPQVIAVSATDRFDAFASFSNRGRSISVAAPGVSVLSLRGANAGPVGGTVVAGDYLLLSGTSMASPHVAGLAALLLEAEPTLTPDEVRWHIELNADQPGYPGYEGQPWNPYYGWGRINAARVFDPVPATTRLSTIPFGSYHAFAGTQSTTPDYADVGFTTTAPVSWTLSAPSWVVPSITDGVGPRRVTFSFDASALAVGSYTGNVTVTAPATVNGGGSLPVSAVVHRDERLGPEVEIPLAEPFDLSSKPDAASDGVGTLVVWAGHTIDVEATHVWATRVDGGGGVTAPVRVSGPGLHVDPAVASDGRSSLVVWLSEGDRNLWSVLGVRVAPDGTPIDSVPFVIESRRLPSQNSWHATDVAFDGTAYAVIWTQYAPGGRIVYLRRVGSDGSVRGKRRRLYPNTGTVFPGPPVTPRIACNQAGRCLVAWEQQDGDFEVNVHGVRIADETILDPAAPQLLADVVWLKDVATNGSDFFLLGWRTSGCGADVTCYDAVGARVTAAGATLDPAGIRLNRDPPEPSVYVEPESVTFDGTHWVATLFGHATGRGIPIFVARVAADGQVVDTEAEGLLAQNTGTAGSHVLVATHTHHVLAWNDSRTGVPGFETIFAVRSVWSERLLAHPTVPALADRAIGSIGGHVVAERATLAFTVAAPGLDPSQTTYDASNLPPGAVFDPTTRIFQWTPAADEQGVYPAVGFTATDGTTTRNEQVEITVTEAVLSVGGTVRTSTGTPVAGVALQLRGTPDRKRIALTDRDGRFRFEGLAAGRYLVKLARASRRAYRATPRRLVVTVAGTDAIGLDLVVAAK